MTVIDKIDFSIFMINNDSDGRAGRRAVQRSLHGGSGSQSQPTSGTSRFFDNTDLTMTMICIRS